MLEAILKLESKLESEETQNELKKNVNVYLTTASNPNYQKYGGKKMSLLSIAVMFCDYQLSKNVHSISKITTLTFQIPQTR